MTQKDHDELADKLKQAQEEAAAQDKQEAADLDQQDQDLQTKLDEMTEHAKRTMADLQNLKRRQEEEKANWIKLANADLIKAILPTLDNLERAKEHLPQDDTTQGLIMSIDQLHKTLTDFGLTPMETVGQAFNPDLHEAVAQGEGAKDTVVEEFEKGYLLGDRVIRHAKVKVGQD